MVLTVDTLILFLLESSIVGVGDQVNIGTDCCLMVKPVLEHQGGKTGSSKIAQLSDILQCTEHFFH